MILAFYIFAGILLFLSYRSFRGGTAYLNYFKSELAKPLADLTPYASLFVPCRGLDEGIEENLAALLHQDYPAYEVVFVDDDAQDPAVAAIEAARDLLNREETGTLGSVDTKFVVAPKAKASSQKVENLREAVLHADNRSRVFVFADSDARPSNDWLRSLAAPLQDDSVGAATGYRWFISRQPGFASEMRSAWNASIASALGPNNKSNFCWGGAMAIRRDTFERLGIRERWSGTLSDDFTLTKAMIEAGLAIYFVPRAITASVEGCTLRELLEFTTRQMKITRVYAPKLWLVSFLGSGLFTFVLLAALFIMVLGDRRNAAFWVATVVAVLVFFFSVGKSWLRLKAVRMALPEYRVELKRQFIPQNTLWLLAPPLFLFNCFAALLSRTIRWRGTTYHLVAPTQTGVIERPR